MLASGIILFVTGGLHLVNYMEIKSAPTTFEVIGAIAALIQMVVGVILMLASIPGM